MPGAIIPCSVAAISLACSRGSVPPDHSASLMSAWMSEAGLLACMAFGDLHCGCDGGMVGGQGACLHHDPAGLGVLEDVGADSGDERAQDSLGERRSAVAFL